MAEVIDTETGEFDEERRWIGELRVPVGRLEGLPQREADRTGRRFVGTPSVREALTAVERACGHQVEWARYVGCGRGAA